MHIIIDARGKPKSVFGDPVCKQFNKLRREGPIIILSSCLDSAIKFPMFTTTLLNVGHVNMLTMYRPQIMT